MATAIISGLDKNKWKIIVCDVVPEQRLKIQKLGVNTVDNLSTINKADILFFAIKPQIVAEVLSQLKHIDLSHKTIISIMAGIPLSRLRASIHGKDIKYVRTLPNTALMVGKGVTGVYLENVSSKQIIEEILGPLSMLFYIQNESDLDIVTAISGSGPAYFIAFMEALREAAVSMGFTLRRCQ